MPNEEYYRATDKAVSGIVADLFKKNSTIIDLNLNNTRMTESGWGSFIDGLKTNSSLTSVDVSHAVFDTKSAANYGDSFKNNSTIRSLNLSAVERLNAQQSGFGFGK